MSVKKYFEEEEDQSKLTLEDLDFSANYTYADYLKWTFEERVELIKGKIFKMSAPLTNHQILSGRLISELYIYLKGKPCRSFNAPFDVRLPRKSKDDKDVTTVVQPDVCVICDPSKLDKKGCIGAPDIVVEILSLTNNKKDLKYKYEVYEEAGVKEYWLIHPAEQTFLKYVLDENGKFNPSHLMTTGEEVTTPILPGFVLNLDEFFKDLIEY